MTLLKKENWIPRFKVSILNESEAVPMFIPTQQSFVKYLCMSTHLWMTLLTTVAFNKENDYNLKALKYNL